MKVLVISDTHGSFYELKKVIDAEKPFDVLVHCGDICGNLTSAIGTSPGYHVHMVAGNCDLPGAFPTEDVFALGSHRAFLAHGHRLRVDRNNDGLLHAAKEKECDIAFYGHTHVPECVVERDVLVINPGSLVQPRTQDGRPSYAILTIDDDGTAKGQIVFQEPITTF